MQHAGSEYTGFDHHYSDVDGNPSGGASFGRGYTISWQKGPIGSLLPGNEREEPNGAFVEDILTAAAKRLEFYEQSRFACQANAKAIRAIEKALQHLRSRTSDRVRRGVEGTHAV